MGDKSRNIIYSTQILIIEEYLYIFIKSIYIYIINQFECLFSISLSSLFSLYNFFKISSVTNNFSINYSLVKLSYVPNNPTLGSTLLSSF